MLQVFYAENSLNSSETQASTCTTNEGEKLEVKQKKIECLQSVVHRESIHSFALYFDCLNQMRCFPFCKIVHFLHRSQF